MASDALFKLESERKEYFVVDVMVCYDERATWIKSIEKATVCESRDRDG